MPERTREEIEAAADVLRAYFDDEYIERIARRALEAADDIRDKKQSDPAWVRDYEKRLVSDEGPATYRQWKWPKDMKWHKV